MSEHWAEALSAHWGIEADLHRLDGEYDLNFRAEARDGAAYVLKVMRPGCEAALIEMQIAALTHLAKTAPEVPLPRVVPAGGGDLLVEAPDAAGETRLVWLQEALPGTRYADFRPHDPALIEDLGRQAGALAAGLAGAMLHDA